MTPFPASPAHTEGQQTGDLCRETYRGWIIVQATWLEELRSGKVVTSRNALFCPVELGIKPPMHGTDRGPPDTKTSREGSGQWGLIHWLPNQPSLPRTSSGISTSKQVQVAYRVLRRDW
jgi:hypothetical protein